MVPIVKTSSGALVSGAPQEHSPIPVGKPDATGRMVEGLRSEDGGASCEQPGADITQNYICVRC